MEWMAVRYQAAVAKELKKYGLRYEDLYDPLLDMVRPWHNDGSFSFSKRAVKFLACFIRLLQALTRRVVTRPLHNRQVLYSAVSCMVFC